MFGVHSLAIRKACLEIMCTQCRTLSLASIMASHSQSLSSSAQHCQICKTQPAVVFCCCTSQPTLLCTGCNFQHQAQNLSTPHSILPTGALRGHPDEYKRKYSALTIAKSELRKNVERMDDCCEALTASVEKAIEYLKKSRRMWVQWMKDEKGRMLTEVETAIQEAEFCLGQGTTPSHPLAQALLSLPLDGLRVVEYLVTPPDLETACKDWVTYRNSLQTLYDHFPAQAPVAAASFPEAPMFHRDQQPTQQLAYVKPRCVKFFNQTRKDWELCNLAVQIAVDFGSRYVWAGAQLFVSGGRARQE